MNRRKITSFFSTVIDDNGAVTMQYVLEKVQKLSDSIERRCFRNDIYTFLDGRLNINRHRITGLLDSID